MRDHTKKNDTYNTNGYRLIIQKKTHTTVITIVVLTTSDNDMGVIRLTW